MRHFNINVTLFGILILSGILSFSCENKNTEIYDYSAFPQGTILSGKTNDENTFYTKTIYISHQQ